MPDEDGYPTKAELTKLRELASMYGQDRTSKDKHEKLVEFLEHIWWHPDCGIVIKRNCKDKLISLQLHTGGWSGNEDIIDVLRKTDFWSLHWVSSRRGGHFCFTFRKINEEARK